MTNTNIHVNDGLQTKKKRRKSTRALRLDNRKKKIKTKPVQSPSVPTREVLPRSAKRVVSVSRTTSNIDNATLNLDEDEEDTDVYIDVSVDGGDEDRHEVLDAHDEFEDVSQVGTLNQQEERLLISLHYRQLGSPPPNKWDGRGGAISVIASAINFTEKQRDRIKKVITSTYESLTSGQQYNPSRVPRNPNSKHQC